MSGLAAVGTNETGTVKGVFRGSVTWKVSIQGGLLQKMLLKSFGEVGQDGINYLSIRLWEQGRYCIRLGFGASDNSPGLRSHMFALLHIHIARLQVNHDFMLYLQL